MNLLKRRMKNIEEPDGSEDEYENIDVSEYVSEGDDEIGDYKLRDDNYPEEDDGRQLPFKKETSFYETLIAQLGLLKLSDKEKVIAGQIVAVLMRTVIYAEKRPPLSMILLFARM